MKKYLLIPLVACFAACNDDNADAPTKTAEITSQGIVTNSADTSWTPIDSAQATKAFGEYATPGDPHEKLAAANGKWTATQTVWWVPDGPPMTANSTMTNRMILGGRYQESTYKGNFDGMPFEGLSITGYDNYTKKYTATWVDNMGTGTLSMEGTWDESKKAYTFEGTMINPANGKECTTREVYTIVDDKNHIMELWGPDPKTGKLFRTMEIKLKKA